MKGMLMLLVTGVRGVEGRKPFQRERGTTRRKQKFHSLYRGGAHLKEVRLVAKKKITDSLGSIISFNYLALPLIRSYLLGGWSSNQRGTFAIESTPGERGSHAPRGSIRRLSYGTVITNKAAEKCSGQL